MTHPPGGPVTSPPPSGPRERQPIEPLDPDSPKGIAIANELSQVLAEIQVAIWRRERDTPAADAA